MPPSRRDVIGTALELGELAAAALVVRPLGGRRVVRTAAELRVEAAALLAGPVGGVQQVRAAAPLGAPARSCLLTA